MAALFATMRPKGRAEDSKPTRVVILRALQLGDLLCAVPAFRALRAAWPNARLVLVGLPWARDFVRRFRDYLDDFHEFPGYPGLPERPPDVRQIPAFLQAIQNEQYDLAVQLHGSGSIVNELVALMGAKRAAGFYRSGDHRPDPDLFCPYPVEGLEVNRLLKLIEHLGLPSQGAHLEFPLGEADFQAFAQSPAAQLCPGSYVCIHPGASVAPRRWPVERFTAVARRIADRGYGIALTGTAAEVGLTRPIAAAVPQAIDLSGRTDLGTLGALLSRSALLICNDTGVSHVAAGLRTPSVVISTGDNPARWAPADHGRHRVLADAADVSADDVFGAATALLNAKLAPCLQVAP